LPVNARQHFLHRPDRHNAIYKRFNEDGADCKLRCLQFSGSWPMVEAISPNSTSSSVLPTVLPATLRLLIELRSLPTTGRWL
jgi:hypothetical protein